MARTGKPGRPPGPEPIPQTVAKALFEHLAHGRTLREFASQRGNPSARTILDWRAADEAFAAAYQHARDVGFDTLADEALQIADEDPQEGVAFDGAFVARQRLRVETRLRLLAVWCPRNYGNRTQLHHEGSVSVQVVTGVPQVETDQPAAPPAELPAIAPVLQINTGFSVRRAEG
ncbi:MAG: hypothetical protein IPK26_27370 [Planctomycetes bacterium]|nr:hypothetical protein [Planctomycetota bacterium]